MWTDNTNSSSSKRPRLNPAAAAAIASVGAVLPHAPRRRKSRSPPSSLPTGDAFLLARVRAVLTTADSARTSVRHVRARVVAEGPGAPVPSKQAVRRAVDTVLSERQGGDRAGVQALLGGSGGGGVGAHAPVAAPTVVLPVGLSAAEADAYTQAITGDGVLLSAADELAMPFADDPRVDTIAAALAVADALAAGGTSPAAAADGARAAVAVSSAALSAVWIDSFRKGRGNMASWAARFRPPGVDGAGGGGDGGGAAPTPRRQVMRVPAAPGRAAVPRMYMPRRTAAFSGVSKPPPAAATTILDDETTIASAVNGLDATAATVLDRAVGAGVRPGVVCAAAAKLRRG